MKDGWVCLEDLKKQGRAVDWKVKTRVKQALPEMNYHEKHTRSMSSSFPNRSALEEEGGEESFRNYTLFTNSIKNPPKMVTPSMTATDDGSGTASNPKNIINSRRRSESYAVYSGQDYFVGSASPTDRYKFQEELNQRYFSPTESSSQSIYSQHQNLNLDKKIILYKTEMCRTFEETGICKYGIKCQFAHDPNEIRNIPRHPRYKTEICKTFWQLGNCPYGKRCCFIHTENELRDNKNPLAASGKVSMTKSNDLYGSVDSAVNDDSLIFGDIKSHNSSRSESPSRVAEDLKKTISNLGANSLFSNIGMTTNNPISSRRKSIVDDRIEELAMLIGSNCSLENDLKSGTSVKAIAGSAPNSEDPEFKNSPQNSFELWSRESPTKCSEPSIDVDKMQNQAANSKFCLFDRSPGSRHVEYFTNGIWSSGTNSNNLSILPGTDLYTNIADKESAGGKNSSGTNSSKSQGSDHQQLLIDMLNLLDSSN